MPGAGLRGAGLLSRSSPGQFVVAFPKDLSHAIIARSEQGQRGWTVPRVRTLDYCGRRWLHHYHFQASDRTARLTHPRRALNLTGTVWMRPVHRLQRPEVGTDSCCSYALFPLVCEIDLRPCDNGAGDDRRERSTPYFAYRRFGILLALRWRLRLKRGLRG